ncbi:MAG: hypothetical protein SO415_11620, partial [Oliverpabstia sp.]|nr:hypothetical protein [Oliverpabstia sp.]
ITQATTLGYLNPPSKASGIAVALFKIFLHQIINHLCCIPFCQVPYILLPTRNYIMEKILLH